MIKNNDYSTSNVIGYIGKVTLKKYDTKRKRIISQTEVKNNGTKHLFHFLCASLIGQYDPSKRPQYIDVCSTTIGWTDSGVVTEDIKNTNLSYRSKLSNTAVIVDEQRQSYRVRYQAIISYGQLLNASSTINSILLYPNKDMQDKQSVMAYINLKQPERLDPGQSFLIDWELQFSNVTVEV